MINAAKINEDFCHIDARNTAALVILDDFEREGDPAPVESLITGIEAQIGAVDRFERIFDHCTSCDRGLCAACKVVQSSLTKIRHTSIEITSLLRAGLEERNDKTEVYTAARTIAASQRAYINRLSDALSAF